LEATAFGIVIWFLLVILAPQDSTILGLAQEDLVGNRLKNAKR
jgi:hypothetical protein